MAQTGKPESIKAYHTIESISKHKRHNLRERLMLKGFEEKDAKGILNPSKSMRADIFKPHEIVDVFKSIGRVAGLQELEELAQYVYDAMPTTAHESRRIPTMPCEQLPYEGAAQFLVLPEVQPIMIERVLAKHAVGKFIQERYGQELGEEVWDANPRITRPFFARASNDPVRSRMLEDLQHLVNGDAKRLWLPPELTCEPITIVPTHLEHAVA